MLGVVYSAALIGEPYMPHVILFFLRTPHICYSTNPHHRHVRHAVTSLAEDVMENTSKTLLELEAWTRSRRARADGNC